MIAEHTKLLNQESRRRAAPNVQSITDKMSRLTNRKVTLQKPKMMVNEYGSSNNNANSGDKGVVNNHSKNKSSTTVAEGKISLYANYYMFLYKKKNTKLVQGSHLAHIAIVNASIVLNIDNRQKMIEQKKVINHQTHGREKKKII